MKNILRIRRQGSEMIETCGMSFAQSGRLTAVIENANGASVVMHAGRMTLEFFIADFASLFQGHQRAQLLLRDAARHRDFVEIHVMRERLSYSNPAQYARGKQS